MSAIFKETSIIAFNILNESGKRGHKNQTLGAGIGSEAMGVAIGATVLGVSSFFRRNIKGESSK